MINTHKYVMITLHFVHLKNIYIYIYIIPNMEGWAPASGFSIIFLAQQLVNDAVWFQNACRLCHSCRFSIATSCSLIYFPFFPSCSLFFVRNFRRPAQPPQIMKSVAAIVDGPFCDTSCFRLLSASPSLRSCTRCLLVSILLHRWRCDSSAPHSGSPPCFILSLSSLYLLAFLLCLLYSLL